MTCIPQAKAPARGSTLDCSHRLRSCYVSTNRDKYAIVAKLGLLVVTFSPNKFISKVAASASTNDRNTCPRWSDLFLTTNRRSAQQKSSYCKTANRSTTSCAASVTNKTG